ncbi:hypothetical protein MTR67_051546 [Solanum verrucosum]|uniref:Putative plant transposon protein domain-containing protein n=1 Tax=Solanum verrucosum TaxID=315347 RepID=A0AAF0V7H5_SOLVR|nr:hypothetical protein MTR67_051546 [Solanum verrucosum]
MARPKVTGRNQPPQKRARGIVINEEAAASRALVTKLFPNRGKGKGKGPVQPTPTEESSYIEGIYTTIPVPHMPPPPLPPAQKVVQAPPPVQAHPPRSLNRLKAESLRTILEEKWLSTNSVIPTWVHEFYSAYGELVPKGKKKVNMFKLVDNVMVRGKKVKCSSSEINEVFGCSRDFMHDYIDLIKKKTLDDLKGWLAPLIFYMTPSWIKPGVSIGKKDLNMAAGYWFGFISSTIMPSQNESILRHPKGVCLGSIMDRNRLNLGLLIEQEMARYVLVFAKMDVEVTSTSSTDIQQIEADIKRVAPMDSSLIVDVDMLPTEAILPF